jgi:hypothetical protein
MMDTLAGGRPDGDEAAATSLNGADGVVSRRCVRLNSRSVVDTTLRG